MSELEKSKRKYDLEERTAKFTEDVIDFVKILPRDSRFAGPVSQLVNATSSVGANYCEADDAQSKKDFCHKIAICKKESRESKYWLRVIAKIFPESQTAARVLWKEAQELNLIFASIINNKKD